jgi:hypothetical protein
MVILWFFNFFLFLTKICQILHNIKKKKKSRIAKKKLGQRTVEEPEFFK